MDDWGIGEVLAVAAIAFVGVAVLIVLAFLVTHLLRSPDVSGWGKVGWLLVLLLLPVVGLIVYIVVRAPALSLRPAGRSGDERFAIGDAGDPGEGGGPPSGGGATR